MVEQKQVAEDFDAIVENYNDKIDSAVSFAGVEHKFFINGKADKIIELAAKTFPDPSRIAALDIGCGVGNYLQAFNGKFGAVSGIDVSEQSVNYAREHNPGAACFTYDGSELPMAENSFDLAYAICVMHHVPPPAWPHFVAEMKRVLKPGGLALIFEHNPLNPATQYVVRSCDIDKDAVLLWPRQMKRLFQNAGFDAIQARTIFSVLPIGGALKKVDHWLGAMPFGAQYYLSARKPLTS